MYIIVWKYKVKSTDRSGFETEYGPGGTWVNFFRVSTGYLGSKLYSGKDQSYLSVEAWDSKHSQQSFMEANRDTFLQLHERCSYLIEEGVCVGDFTEIKGVLTTIL